MKKSILILAAAALTVSCTKTEIFENNPDANGVLIQAKPVHELVSGEVTRAPFSGNITNDNKLNAQVLTYSEDGNIYANGVMNFASTTDPITYASVTTDPGTKKFAAQDDEEYTMYGLYPATDWTLTAATMAADKPAFTFTGKEDVMVAAAATTSANDVLAGTYPALTFKHQLTKFVVKVKAMDEAAAAVWKDLSEITLTQILSNPANVKNVATYNPNTGDMAFSKTSDDPMSFYVINASQVYTETAFAAQAVDILVPNAEATNIRPVAYSMVAPFIPANDKDITLSVKASFFDEEEGDDGEFVDATRTVNLNVPAVPAPALNTAGYAYTITLTFTDQLDIVATVAVEDWIPGDDIGGVVI